MNLLRKSLERLMEGKKEKTAPLAHFCWVIERLSFSPPYCLMPRFYGCFKMTRN
jgi:hypothetical protein